MVVHTRAKQARPKVKAAREEGTSPAKAAGALSLQSFRARSHSIHSVCITPLFCVKTTPALITPEKNDNNSEWHVRVRSDGTQRVYCDSPSCQYCDFFVREHLHIGSACSRTETRKELQWVHPYTARGRQANGGGISGRQSGNNRKLAAWLKKWEEGEIMAAWSVGITVHVIDCSVITEKLRA